MNIVSLFGQTSLAVSDSVFRRKLYFIQLDEKQREKERERRRDRDREKERQRQREKERETETERELIKDGCEKRSEIFKYFHFCAKYFSMKVVVATQHFYNSRRTKLKILNRVFVQVIPIERFITHQLFIRHDDFPWNRRILQIFFLVA